MANTAGARWRRIKERAGRVRRRNMSDGREEREEQEKRRELERKRDLEDRVDRSWMSEDKPERRDS